MRTLVALLTAMTLTSFARAQTVGFSGNVSVWTKADSVTLFDDFSYGAS